jgi:uncharacterized DUF497 family protein
MKWDETGDQTWTNMHGFSWEDLKKVSWGREK